MYYEILKQSYKDFMFKTFGHKKDIYNFLINHETFTLAVQHAADQFIEVKKRNLKLDEDTVKLVGNDFCRVWCLAILNRKEAELRNKFSTVADFDKDPNTIMREANEVKKDKMKTDHWDKLMENKEKKNHVKPYIIGSDKKRESEVEIA